MLVIRMQRTGRKGHAQFRVVVQDSRRTPTSGKIVAALGHFNPHTKENTLNKEKAAFYLEHGAQPSDRVVRLLQSEGVALPTWVKLASKKTGEVRHADKRRSTRPAEEVEEAPAEEVAEVTDAEVAETEAVVEETATEVAESTEQVAESEEAVADNAAAADEADASEEA